jgi:selenocysteine lyase/cysteine desulfurase
VVICPDLEHPNNVFLWYNLQKLQGVEIRALEPDEGRLPYDAMEAAMDGRTRVVTAPHVSFSPGFVSDVRRVADAAHRHGALVVVDAAQSVGALVTHVDALGADALAVATQKCLLALYGYGFLYVRRGVAEGLIPRHVARYGMDLGVDAGETARTGGVDLPFAAGARRFDLGNYNYLGARAAEASLELLMAVGVDRIEAHVRALAAALARGFLELGLPVAGGAPGPHLAHIVAVGESGGGHHDSADDPVMNELHRHLLLDGVRHSIRKGVLRFSIGAYNDESDIHRVLASAGSWVARRG